jgi:DNA-binding NtrC family response regulator
MPSSRILVVDDDPVFSQFTQNLLTENGMEAMTAFNKADALDLLDRHHFSCAIFDIFLRRERGGPHQAPPHQRQRHPHHHGLRQEDVDEVVRAMKDGRTTTSRSPSGAKSRS